MHLSATAAETRAEAGRSEYSLWGAVCSAACFLPVRIRHWRALFCGTQAFVLLTRTELFIRGGLGGHAACLPVCLLLLSSQQPPAPVYKSQPFVCGSVQQGFLFMLSLWCTLLFPSAPEGRFGSEYLVWAQGGNVTENILYTCTWLHQNTSSVYLQRKLCCSSEVESPHTNKSNKLASSLLLSLHH